MGVPKFYRWVSERWPLINQILTQGVSVVPEYGAFRINTSAAIDPCGVAQPAPAALFLRRRDLTLACFADNLYLDMNGIIHNCSHPNDNDIHQRITENDVSLRDSPSLSLTLRTDPPPPHQHQNHLRDIAGRDRC